METVLICLCVGCIISGATGTLTMRPKNYAVMRGQGARMECQTDNSEMKLRWERDLFAYQEEAEKIVFNGYNISSFVAPFCKLIPGSAGEYNIGIDALDEAAQRYKCVEPRTLEYGSAELIVLSSDPLCVDSSDSDYINASCTILFRGNWPPEMHWTVNGVEIPKDSVTKVLQVNKSLTSSLVIQRDLTSYSILLKTNFSLHLKPSVTTAVNVPTYSNTFLLSISKDKIGSANDLNIVALAICCPLAILLVGGVIFIILCRRYKDSRVNVAIPRSTGSGTGL